MDVDIKVEGLKNALVQINKIDKSLRQQYTREMKAIVEPGITDIKNKMGVAHPSGMDHNGRTRWVAPKVVLKQNTRRARNRNMVNGQNVETIATITIGTRGAAVQMVDQAHKSSGAGRSKPYDGRPNGHALNGQPDAFVTALDKYFGSHAPSRFMWPGIDNALPGITLRIEAVAKRVVYDANRLIARGKD